MRQARDPTTYDLVAEDEIYDIIEEFIRNLGPEPPAAPWRPARRLNRDPAGLVAVNGIVNNIVFNDVMAKETHGDASAAEHGSAQSMCEAGSSYDRSETHGDGSAAGCGGALSGCSSHSQDQGGGGADSAAGDPGSPNAMDGSGTDPAEPDDNEATLGMSGKDDMLAGPRPSARDEAPPFTTQSGLQMMGGGESMTQGALLNSG